MKTTSRPYLKLEPSTLKEISNSLSIDACSRGEFINSPQQFLEKRGILLKSYYLWKAFGNKAEIVE